MTENAEKEVLNKDEELKPKKFQYNLDDESLREIGLELLENNVFPKPEQNKKQSVISQAFKDYPLLYALLATIISASVAIPFAVFIIGRFFGTK